MAAKTIDVDTMSFDLDTRKIAQPDCSAALKRVPETAAYDACFGNRNRSKASLNDTPPSIPHAEVMVAVQTVIDGAKRPPIPDTVTLEW